MCVYIYTHSSYIYETYVKTHIMNTYTMHHIHLSHFISNPPRVLPPSPPWNRVDTFGRDKGREATGNSTKQGPNQCPDHQMSALFSCDLIVVVWENAAGFHEENCWYLLGIYIYISTYIYIYIRIYLLWFIPEFDWYTGDIYWKYFHGSCWLFCWAPSLKRKRDKSLGISKAKVLWG